MTSFIVRHAILLYALQVVACSALFWLFYKGVIERGRHFALCRWFLLFTLVAPVAIPLVSIPIYPATPAMTVAPMGYLTVPTIETFIEDAPQTHVDLRLLLIFVYLITCCSLAVKLAFRLLSLFCIKRSGHKTKDGAFLIIRSPKIETPFSFIRTIYLPKIVEATEEKLFLLHEKAHIKERHSFDILLHEALSVLYWFNPIFWLTGREIKRIHEYQADRAAISLTPSARLYQTLIAKEFLGFSPKITHAFNGTLTKKRIIMLTQPFQSNCAVLRMALIIPFIALNLLLFSCTAKEPEQDTNMSATKADTSTQVLPFEVVETKPSFLGGGENNFSAWINEQISYPELAKESGIQGRVILSFIIDTDGHLQDVTVLRGADPILDREAVRVVASSPKWTPGVHNGERVQVRYNFPVIFLLHGGSNAPSSPSSTSRTLQSAATEDNGVFALGTVEQKPSFQGGDENDFSAWVNKQISYPELAKESSIQGRVTLSFLIDIDGSLQDVTVLRGVDPILDREAVRAVASSPKWTPGTHAGQAVKVRYIFPVVFQLR